MSDTLFAMEEVKARPWVDWFNLYAIQKAGMPEGWRWFSSELLNYQAPRSAQSYLLCGAVVPNITKGKHAGHPAWKGRDKTKDRSFSVSCPALEEFKAEWERAEGKCHECFGTGEAWAGWAKDAGTVYRTCKRCGGTGGPRSAQALP
ncbi:hypothetical protein [Devosia sp. A369]